MNTQAGQRFMGWVLMTMALIHLSLQAIVGAGLGMLPSLILIIGIFLVVKTSAVFGPSDSTLQILQEIGRRKARLAHHVHRRPRWQNLQETAKENATVAQVIGLLVVIVALFLPATYAFTVAVMALGLGWLAYAAWKGNHFEAFWVSLLFMLLMVVWAAQGTPNGMVRQNSVPLEGAYQALLMIGTILFTVLSFAAVAWKRRDEVRGWVQAYLVATVAGFVTVVYLVTVPNSGQITMWISSILGLCLYLAILSAVSWQRHSRCSYVKYFVLLTVCLLFFSSLFINDVVYAALVWLGLTVMLMAAGFSISSYTTRSAGLMLGAMSVTLYALRVIPLVQYANQRVSVVALGVMIIVFSATVLHWYRQLPKRSQEHAYLPAIEHGLAFAMFVTAILMLVSAGLDRLPTIGLGLLIGIAGACLAKLWELPLLRVFSYAVLAMYVLLFLSTL